MRSLSDKMRVERRYAYDFLTPTGTRITAARAGTVLQVEQSRMASSSTPVSTTTSRERSFVIELLHLVTPDVERRAQRVMDNYERQARRLSCGAHVNHRLNPRRDFLRTVSIGSTVAAAAGLEACASSVAAITTSPSPQPAGEWDLSWVDRLKAPYRIVFNITQKGELGLMQTALWMQGFRQAYRTQDNDLNAVLVFRHEAVAMMLNDAMWARLAITESSGGSGNSSAAAPGRNPWLGVPGSSATSGSQDTDYTISALRARGVIMLACNMALRGQVSRLRQKENLAADAADQAIRNAIVPGCYIVPNGIFAVSRAQMAGCAYFAPG